MIWASDNQHKFAKVHSEISMVKNRDNIFCKEIDSAVCYHVLPNVNIFRVSHEI